MMKAKMTTTTAAIMMPKGNYNHADDSKGVSQGEVLRKSEKSLSMIFIRMNEINVRVKKWKWAPGNDEGRFSPSSYAAAEWMIETDRSCREEQTGWRWMGSSWWSVAIIRDSRLLDLPPSPPRSASASASASTSTAPASTSSVSCNCFRGARFSIAVLGLKWS